MINRYLLLTLLSLFIFKSSSGQGHFPVVAMELQKTAIANNLFNGQPDISDSTVFNVVMKIVISDTTSITLLQVDLKRSVDDQTNIFTKSFTYDVSGTFPDGTSYTRNQYDIVINLGNYMGTINPYAELIVVNNSGNVTDPISYY